MADEGNCWYMPMMFCELPELWNDNGKHIDVAMFQVGPMDSNGDFNLGPQVAEMLINIAHPDFRDQLIREAEKMGIWKQSSKREY